MVLRLAFVLVVLSFAGRAVAQGGVGTVPSAWPPEAIYRGATIAPDLTFPVLGEASNDLTLPRMALLKPAGNGPFPAIALLHQCAGINPAVVAWAREAIARNYAVLLVDSLSPRSVKSVCYGPEAGVNLFRGARDALQAAEHLRRQPFVDKDRIALLGFSWGATVGLLASSSHYAEALKAGPRFRAAASLYPGCSRVSPPNGRAPFEVVNVDIERPLLVLMGAADTETPAVECLEKFNAVKKAGAPIEWYVYPETTHCWDCKQLDGFSKIDVRGHQVEYRFQQLVTEDSERRLFEFLDRVMPQHQ